MRSVLFLALALFLSGCCPCEPAPRPSEPRSTRSPAPVPMEGFYAERFGFGM
jgi:hypothetical protein